MERIGFKDIQVYTAAWLPFGRSNMEALNRFVGSHKKYSSATEFGIHGMISNMEKGKITMNAHGVFLTPIDYDYTGFLKAALRVNSVSESEFGIEFNKSGLSTLGIRLEKDTIRNSDKIKMITGNLSYKYSRYVLPLLTDVQQSLLSGIYQVQNFTGIGYKLHTYSVVKCSVADQKECTADELWQKYSKDISSVTDWITTKVTIDDCHLFIGMAACLCIGETTEKVDDFLKKVLYLNTSRITAQRLHSLLWSLRRRIQSYRQNIAGGSYKVLKKTNEQLCTTSNILSKVSVFDQMLRDETRSEFHDFKKEMDAIEEPLRKEIETEFEHEIEKSENREITLQQLSDEISVLTSELENKLELIMTKDNMHLNLILLILTIISILGVAEVLDFSREQWEVVAAFVVPFGLFVIYYVYNFLRNFQLRDSELNH
tara:strand:- start:28033 stop:29319 length:1287 start_codon:yes stop_codon:yes gene_type:complete